MTHTSTIYSLFLVCSTPLLLSMNNYQELYSPLDNDSRYEGIPIQYQETYKPLLTPDTNTSSVNEQQPLLFNQTAISSTTSAIVNHDITNNSCDHQTNSTVQSNHSCCTRNYSGKCYNSRCGVMKSATLLTACCSAVKVLAWCTGTTPAYSCSDDYCPHCSCTADSCNDLWFPPCCTNCATDPCPDIRCFICCNVITWGHSIATIGAGATILAAWIPCPKHCISENEELQENVLN
jgi:hypothetical protein